MSHYNWAAWQAAQRCVGSARPGARAFLAWLEEEYRPPGYSLGIYNCRDVAGGSSLSAHAEGRAIDWGLPYVDGAPNPLGFQIIDRFGPHGARLGIGFVVFARVKFGQSYPDGAAYNGSHPHYDHIHIELTRAAGENLTLATIRSVLAQETRPVTASRIAGADRYESAVLIAQTAYPYESNQNGTVYLARGDKWSPEQSAAGSLRAPVLLVASDSLPSATNKALRRYRPKSVVALGGPEAISDAVLESARRAAASG